MSYGLKWIVAFFWSASQGNQSVIIRWFKISYVIFFSPAILSHRFQEFPTHISILRAPPLIATFCVYLVQVDGDHPGPDLPPTLATYRLQPNTRPIFTVVHLGPENVSFQFVTKYSHMCFTKSKRGNLPWVFPAKISTRAFIFLVSKFYTVWGAYPQHI